MDKLIWILVASLAGAFLPVQGGVNALFGKQANSPIHASLLSFCVGTLLLFLFVVVSRQTVSWEGIKSTPWYSWLGGAFGAFSLTAIIVCMPKLGPGLTFGLLVAGQMIISVVLEHFNVLVAHPHPLTLLRMAGILLIVIGVILIRMF